jgi:hypothetical protein
MAINDTIIDMITAATIKLTVLVGHILVPLSSGVKSLGSRDRRGEGRGDRSSVLPKAECSIEPANRTSSRHRSSATADTPASASSYLTDAFLSSATGPGWVPVGCP